jgi:phage FluMu protein Com
MGTDEKKEEIFFEVRCSVCSKILFEVTEETIGTVKKKCDRCRQMRQVRLPLTRRAQASSIPFNADRKAA